MMKNIQVQERFAAAHGEYSDALLRYAIYKVNDREMAKDLVQDSFLSAWKYASNGNEVGNMKALLFKILNNHIIDEYRKKTRCESLENLKEDGFDPGFDDTASWADAIDGKRAVKLMGKLKEPYRKVIKMRYMEGLSLSEIVESVDATKNSVAVRIHRGMGMLHDLFMSEPSSVLSARL